jgi:ABC-type polysaccharide/polyol phosphate export permease
MYMNRTIQRRVNTRWKNAVIFIAAMIVGVMAYTGDLVYTPVVLVLLLIAVGIGRYGSEQ